MYNIILMDIFKRFMSMNNPQWPPLLDKYIIFKKRQDNKIFIGKVKVYLWNRTACVVELLNHLYYRENIKKYMNKNIHGILLIPDYKWTYLKETDYIRIMKSFQYKTGNLNKIQDFVLDNKNNISSLHNVHIDTSNIATNIMTNTYDTLYNINDVNTKYIIDPYTNDNIYEFGDYDNQFNMKEIEIRNLNKHEIQYRNDILQAVQRNSPIQHHDAKIFVSPLLALDNLITTEIDLQTVGNQIIDWIKNNMVHKNSELNINTLFPGLNFLIHNGYVHILRDGINPHDNVTNQLVTIQRLTWQNNLPIQYTTLRQFLLKSKTQVTSSEVEILKEAEKIMGLEYLICLQPEPKYVMWCLRRIIRCWYGDELLEQNIRKIKVLINLWRAKSDIDYNKKFAVLPIIVIYPKYGVESARIVLQKINEYFLFYTNCFWKNNSPYFFLKTTDLIYYTNGIIDLRLYYDKLKADSQNIANKDFFKKGLKSIKHTKSMLELSRE